MNTCAPGGLVRTVRRRRTHPLDVSSSAASASAAKSGRARDGAGQAVRAGIGASIKWGREYRNELAASLGRMAFEQACRLAATARDDGIPLSRYTATTALGGRMARL